MITSKQNKKLKELNKIIDQKCSDNSLYALEGFTIFEEAIRENVEIVEFMCQKVQKMSLEVDTISYTQP